MDCGGETPLSKMNTKNRTDARTCVSTKKLFAFFALKKICTKNYRRTPKQRTDARHTIVQTHGVRLYKKKTFRDFRVFRVKKNMY